MIEKCITLNTNKIITVCCKVLYSSCEPVSNAVIEVIQIDKRCPCEQKNTLGYVTTNICGEFCICLEKSSNIYYKFEIYEPLQKVCDN